MTLYLVWTIAVDAFAAFGVAVIVATLYGKFFIPDEFVPLQDIVKLKVREDA
ncbi:MAG TPA: hypothetical protein VFZ08_06330 [Terriglobia bacterium]|nr:hypothetical protein [Terriglobia bacterium]